MSAEYTRTALNIRDEYLRRLINALEELNLQANDPNVRILIDEAKQIMQDSQ